MEMLEDHTNIVGRPNNVLIVSHDVLGEMMAGPGIRYFQLASVLSRKFAVTLAVPHESKSTKPDNFRIIQYTPDEWHTLAPSALGSNVIIVPGLIADEFPMISECGAAIVIDGYDPLLAEWLAASERSSDREMAWTHFASMLTQQCQIGDFFICASERQRDWWLGILEANGRINPFTFDDDPSFRRLIDIVPYGLAAKPRLPSRRVIKGVWDGIREEDRLVLWGGGLWPWLDPFTAIRSFVQVSAQRPDARLIFPGTRHPNPSMQGMPTGAVAARELANELGLLNRSIYFGDWVAYQDWDNVLLESDLALSLHLSETLESRLAFRSRVLDYIWAGLPIVATRGDVTSELIEDNRIGVVVDCGDSDQVAQALLTLLEKPRADFERSFDVLRNTMTWEHVAQPLIEFCTRPHAAPDKIALDRRLGNPFYRAQINRMQGENERLQIALEQSETERAQVQTLAKEYAARSKSLSELVSAYRSRRVVRFADWVGQLLKHSPHS